MRRLILATLFVVLCAAQTTTPPPLPAGPCSWEGVVEDPLAHKPVDHAIVSLSIREASASRDQYASYATSDAKGFWAISNIVCKSLIVNAQKPGYIHWPPLPAAINVAVPNLGPGGTPPPGVQPFSTRIQVTLASRLSSVTGSVLDDAAKPIPTAQIKLITLSASFGRRVQQEVQLVVPDSKGIFNASQLAPGSKEVCAVSNPVPADGPWTRYSRDCTPSPAPGEKKQIKFVLHRVAGVHVRGKVANCRPANCTVSLRQFDEITNSTSKQDLTAGKDGSFDFTGIPPGQYSLRASGSAMTGWLPVTIADADVAGLEIKLLSAVDVRGSVHYPVGFSVLTDPDVTLKSALPLGPRAGSAEWNADHTVFVLKGVEPGHYEFSFRVRNAFPKSAMLNGIDIVDQEFQVEPGIPPIDVTVDDKLAAVEGVTVNPQGDPVNSAVYLIQTGRKPIIGFSNFGAFLGHIPPGEYLIYAFPSDSSIFYLEPDWMAKYGGDPRHVTASVDATAGIRLVERPVEDQ